MWGIHTYIFHTTSIRRQGSMRMKTPAIQVKLRLFAIAQILLHYGML